MVVSRKRDFIVFVRGSYRTTHLQYYLKMCRGRTKIAVNGGLRFFLKTHTLPDLLIGDLDSLRKVPKNLSPGVEILTFPARKDKTDLQLAFEYCLNEQARSIDIVAPTLGQPDHFLGNLMLINLLDQPKHTKSSPRVRFVNVRYEIIFMHDGSEAFSDCRGDIVSLIPLTRHIVLTSQGTEYDVRRAVIQPGDTRGLRNRIALRQATFEITGKALLIHQPPA